MTDAFHYDIFHMSSENPFMIKSLDFFLGKGLTFNSLPDNKF